MILRELQCKDILNYKNAILELLIEVYEINFHFSREKCQSICEEKVELLFGYIQEGSAIIVGAIIDDELVGFLWLYKNNTSGKIRLHINQIVIKSDFRNRGIGKQLMLEAENQAKINNIDILELFVLENNSSAMNMYSSMGFETEKRYMTKKL